MQIYIYTARRGVAEQTVRCSRRRMNFALIERCIHPSIYRIIVAAVGIKAWAMRTRMHDDRLCEERKKRERQAVF